jgi:hypothetical protein
MSRILKSLPLALHTIQASKWIYGQTVVVVLPGHLDFKRVEVEARDGDTHVVFKGVKTFQDNGRIENGKPQPDHIEKD